MARAKASGSGRARVREHGRERGRSSGSLDYRMNHRPGGSGDAPGFDLTVLYPDDVYGLQGAQYYGSGDRALDEEALIILRRARGKPNARVTIYRAVPKTFTFEEELREKREELRYMLKHGKIPPKSRDVAAMLNLSLSQYYEHVSETVAGLEKRLPTESTRRGLEEIHPGDWVTITRDYARQHGEYNLGGRGRYKILQKTVKASEIYNDANSLQEWGYVPSP